MWGAASFAEAESRRQIAGMRSAEAESRRQIAGMRSAGSREQGADSRRQIVGDVRAWGSELRPDYGLQSSL